MRKKPEDKIALVLLQCANRQNIKLCYKVCFVLLGYMGTLYDNTDEKIFLHDYDPNCFFLPLYPVLINCRQGIVGGAVYE